MADPIEDRFLETMNSLATGLDNIFNGDKKGKDRDVVFVFLVTKVGENAKANYISNGTRQDCIAMLREVAARLEGQPKVKPGRA